ncbi:hypothetical protein [Coleofasciculus sp. FACHB-1120]|uniref:hypothetical protein n=1 Tax=Coleofasciculus sp. FACHB-1120 TaxID=2692783 RepID=UPI0018F0292F|nr:hypothetical protein [Coleofasciculus sp. FACHB-1120]
MKSPSRIGYFFFAGIGIVTLAWFVCHTESYFQPYPLIDTKLPSGFSEEKFSSIQLGIKKDEILKILPAPEHSIERNNWSYGVDGAAPWGDFAWISFEMSFDEEGKVIGKKRYVYHD